MQKQAAESNEDLAKIVEKVKSQVKTATESAPNEEEEMEPYPEQPQEKYYSLDQVTLILCAENIGHIISENPLSPLKIRRLQETQTALYILGGLPEFLPQRQVPPEQQPPEQPPVDEADEGLVQDSGIALNAEEKESESMEKLSQKLDAIKSGDMMEQPEPEKPDEGIDKYIPKILKGKKEEQPQVKEKHSPITVG